MSGYRKFKYLLEPVLAACLLLVTLPAFVVIGLYIYLLDGGPVFFVQKRVGRNNYVFNLYKFRTLHNKQYTNFLFRPEDITQSGYLLRNTGLDELPQLINILRGEMSFIGPRPLPVAYGHIIYKHPRAQLRPGISGLVQTRGGNALSWEERFDLDELYVKSENLATDIKIIFKTGIQLGQAKRESTVTLE